MAWQDNIPLMRTLATAIFFLPIDRSSNKMGSRIDTWGVYVVVLRVLTHLGCMKVWMPDPCVSKVLLIWRGTLLSGNSLRVSARIGDQVNCYGCCCCCGSKSSWWERMLALRIGNHGSLPYIWASRKNKQRLVSISGLVLYTPCNKKPRVVTWWTVNRHFSGVHSESFSWRRKSKPMSELQRWVDGDESVSWLRRSWRSFTCRSRSLAASWYNRHDQVYGRGSVNRCWWYTEPSGLQKDGGSTLRPKQLEDNSLWHIYRYHM